jgi:hypothetical protein
MQKEPDFSQAPFAFQSYFLLFAHKNKIKEEDNLLEGGQGMLMIPIWVYFVLIGICLSAYMAIRTGREERKAENENIELEGRIYMERIEKEREDRRNNQQLQ